MPLYTDQLQQVVEIVERPQRVVSLVPSQTEFLYDLGLGERLLGLTKFCIHPPQWRKEKTVVGGTKNFRMEVIDSLKPDLIIGNKEENYKEGIEELASKYPVWMSDIFNIEDSIAMMESLGQILGLSFQAKQLTKGIAQGFDSWEEKKKTLGAPPRAAYLIWKNPYMGVGPNTFIHYLLGRAGLKNVLETARYPEVSLQELQELRLDFLLLSSEPYPFKDKHIEELSEQLPHTKVLLVDGEAFSWYGSRLQHTPAYFEELWAKMSPVQG